MMSCMGLKSQKNNPEIIPQFSVSGRTALFLQQYNELPSDQKADPNSPAFSRLITRYGLKACNDNDNINCYLLCGFMQTDSLFDPNPFLQKKIHLPPPVGNMRTVCIPLTELDFFFSQPHINYFEVASPVIPL